MNKRAFLKTLSAGAMAARQMFPAVTMKKQKLSNWSGNLTYATDRVHDAASVEDIRAVFRSEEKCKVLGSRHCFNSIADSRYNLLTISPANHAMELDAARRMVTVPGSVRYGQLAPELDAKGFALHNLASLPHISIAGACSTATHGSGEKNGNLATAVTALEFVSAGGDLVRLNAEDGDAFHGAVVGLGALGAITKLTLRVEPTYQVRQYVYEGMPLTQMREHFDDIEASGYSVSLFTDWQRQRISEVWVKARVDAAKPFPAPEEFFGAKLAKRDLHPIAELAAENCTEQRGVPGPWYERLPHFRMGFTPSAGKELQTEYFVPRKNAVDAILAVERLRDQVGPHLLISEIRTIAADELWMSPAYRQPSVAIHFTWKQDWPAVRRLLPIVEKELGPYRPRPHWGKLFAVPPAQLRAQYPRLADFVKLAEKYDPHGKFRNDFLNLNIFGARR